ncbi:MAG: class I SAM-dependent methyltransferase [Polyangiaceae bacterium]
MKAARIIQARRSAPPPSGAEEPAPPDQRDADRVPSTPPPVAPAEVPPVAAPATPQELEGAEELTDDDISPESDETPASGPVELADADVAENADDAEEHDIDVAIDMEGASEASDVPAGDLTEGGAKPPPPPRRSAFEDARRAAQQKAEARKAAEEARRASGLDDKRVRRAWWEELFGEDFSRAVGILSETQVTHEADFIEESLGIAKGGVVLDLGCGAGYHAVDLARRGYGVVGYDLSLHQLALAADVAQNSGQKLNLLQGDMREMAFEEMFDGIYCWNTSFGYFEEEKNFNVAQRIFRALRPGGMFLLDVANRDFVVAHQPGQTWFEGDACVCMDDMNVDFITSRLRVKRSLILDDGRSMECNYSIRLYGLHELGKLLHDVGFRVTEASGHPATPGVFFGASSPRIIILAQRP